MKIFDASQVSTMSTLDKVAQDFDFGIDKFPLSGPDNLSTPFYGLFRSDTGASVGRSVSSKYVPHTSDDVLAIVEATQSVFESCDVVTSFRDGHYVQLQPSKDMRKSIFGLNDNIFPRLNIRACYDGKAFKVDVGYFRDLCLNMHIMRCVKSSSVSIRHSNGLRQRMDDLVKQFQKLENGWRDLCLACERMQATDVGLASFLEQVYGKPETPSKQHINRTEAIFNRVLDERRRSGRSLITDKYEVSVWEAFNAVQGHTQWRSTRKGKPSDYDRSILASRDPSVIKAESVAYELSAA